MDARLEREERMKNIYDIAREAGVSIATVSRVLNGSAKVRAATRERVEAVLQSHRYSPNVFARGMVSGSMSTVGVMTIDVRDLYFGTVTYSIEHALQQSGYNTLLSNTGGFPEQQLHYLSILAARKVDGIILVGSVFDDESLEEAVLEVASRIPVVMLNRELTGKNVRSVICDEERGIRDCVAHLAAAGHRRILYIKDTNTYSASRKLTGFRLGMRDAGLPLSPGSIVEARQGFDGGIRAAEAILAAGTPFSALVTGDDVTAAGVCKALRSAGCEPGVDAAVTGCNDSIIARSTRPELTSVDNRPREMGETAAAVLTAVLTGEDPPAVTIVEPNLAVRESSRAPGAEQGAE